MAGFGRIVHCRFQYLALAFYFVRYLPMLIRKVGMVCKENGLRKDSIAMGMAGCPDGFVRPYLSGGHPIWLIRSIGEFMNRGEVRRESFLGSRPTPPVGGCYGQRLMRVQFMSADGWFRQSILCS